MTGGFPTCCAGATSGHAATAAEKPDELAPSHALPSEHALCKA
jgi:hypothetical protein